MASGRVGGTKSKVSGKVGNEVYQIVRNDDGTYSQVIMAKGVKTVETITPRGQAQRMVTCMVESLMRDLKPIATISMQSGANKSKSLNAFSSFNLQLVAQDCKANWYNSTNFIYPSRNNQNTSTEKLGGKFMLSSGTLQFNGFDSLWYSESPKSVLASYQSIDYFFYGIKWNITSSIKTVADFLRTKRMTRLDKICFADFRDWFKYNYVLDESEEFTQYDYMILSINPAIKDDVLLTPSVLSQLFIIESNRAVSQYMSKNGQFFVIGMDCDFANDTEQIWYYGAFTISYMEGRKKISSSNFVVPDGNPEPYWLNHAPTFVFGSWMGEPNNRHYPSPFI